jgi:hypothetical protein
MTSTLRLPSLVTLLNLDALTCASMGAALIGGANLIAGWTDIAAAFLFWTGVILLPIAAFMAISARLKPVSGWAVNIVILGNLGWSIASIVLPVAGIISPNFLGWVLVIGQAIIVALMAFAEFSASRHAIALA